MKIFTFAVKVYLVGQLGEILPFYHAVAQHRNICIYNSLYYSFTRIAIHNWLVLKLFSD